MGTYPSNGHDFINPIFEGTYPYNAVEVNGGGDQVAKFGDALEHYLKKNNMTVVKFTKLISAESYKHGIRFTTADINRYLAGMCCPKNDKLISICKATNLPVDYWTGHWHRSYDPSVMPLPATKQPIRNLVAMV